MAQERAAQPRGEAWRDARARIGDPDARMLLMHVTAASHADLVAHPEVPLDATQQARFDHLVRRRAQGEPVAYLVGIREFYGLAFEVTPATLIPRPETELLVEFALERLPADRRGSLLDLGCGSGAIAISIARQRPLLDVTAIDRSPAALAVAARNADRLLPRGRPGRFVLLESDWYGALGDVRFDLIVANPPYIPVDDPHLDRGDLRFEPADALRSGPDGLDALRTIVAGAKAFVTRGGWLAVEHGYDQAVACRALFTDAGLVDVTQRQDLGGIVRIAAGRHGS